MNISGNTDFIQRTIFPDILEWLGEREIIVITGARQTGKTTLLNRLQQTLGDNKTVYVNFEFSSQLENFTQSPLDFVALQLSEAGVTYFLFDEFQYVDDAGKILKLLFDHFGRQAKFIVTGSSSLAIREIAGYLVGRAIFFELTPFSYAEFLLAKDNKLHRLWQEKHEHLTSFLIEGNQPPAQFDWIFQDEMDAHFQEYVVYGGYPAIVLSRPTLKAKRLEALTDAYVEKDVVNFLRIGNALEFKKLARLLALQIGNLLKYSSLQTDAGLSYREVRRFIGLMENTFILNLLQPYATNPASEIKKSPKVYFVDTGLRNSLISDFRSLDIRTDKGAVVENAVFNQMRITLSAENLRFWRTKQGAEVDFIVTGADQQIVPVEVKYQSLSRPTAPTGLINFIKKYKPRKAIVLNRNLFILKRFQETDILFAPLYFV